MVPFGSLSTGMGCRGDCTDPCVSGGGKLPGEQGRLGSWTLLLGGGRLPDGCINQGDTGRGLEKTLSSTLWLCKIRQMVPPGRVSLCSLYYEGHRKCLL